MVACWWESPLKCKAERRRHHSLHLRVNQCKWHLVLWRVIIVYWSSWPQISQLKVFTDFYPFLYLLFLWTLPGPDENLKGRWHWGFKAPLQHQSQFERIEIFIVVHSLSRFICRILAPSEAYSALTQGSAAKQNNLHELKEPRKLCKCNKLHTGDGARARKWKAGRPRSKSDFESRGRARLVGQGGIYVYRDTAYK